MTNSKELRFKHITCSEGLSTEGYHDYALYGLTEEGIVYIQTTEGWAKLDMEEVITD